MKVSVTATWAAAGTVNLLPAPPAGHYYAITGVIATNTSSTAGSAVFNGTNAGAPSVGLPANNSVVLPDVMENDAWFITSSGSALTATVAGSTAGSITVCYTTY